MHEWNKGDNLLRTCNKCGLLVKKTSSIKWVKVKGDSVSFTGPGDHDATLMSVEEEVWKYNEKDNYKSIHSLPKTCEEVQMHLSLK